MLGLRRIATQNTMNSPAIFCGTVRNGGDALERTLARFDDIREKFEHTKFVIVTNDNSDKTDAILESWSEDRPTENIVISLDGLCSIFPERIERICVARNFYLRAIRELSIKQDWKYLIVADLDGPNQNLNADWFENLDRFDFTWHAIFANQHKAYYDIYALRHPTWSPGDCWHEVDRRIPCEIKRIPKISGLMRKYFANKYVYQRQYRIPHTAKPIEVISAFGGLGIYKTRSILPFEYACRTKEGELVCEHVALNQKIAEKGGRLFIMPDLLNEAPIEHLGRSSGRKYRG